MAAAAVANGLLKLISNKFVYLEYITESNRRLGLPLAGNCAGREPVSRIIVQTLSDAVAHRTALPPGRPECADAAPEGCTDHREDAARAAECEQALRLRVAPAASS